MYDTGGCHHSPGGGSAAIPKVAKLEFGGRSEGLKGLSPKTHLKQNGVPKSVTLDPLSQSPRKSQGGWGRESSTCPVKGVEVRGPGAEL